MLVFVLTTIDLAFLTSKLSATALIGLLFEFVLVIIIFVLSFTIFPFQRLGLKGLIGDIDNFLEFKLSIGP